MISVGSSSSFPEQTTIALKTIRVLAFSQVFRRPIKRNSHRADPTNGVITRNNYYSVLYAKNDGVYCNMIFALRIFRKSRDWRNAVKAGIREKLKKKKKKEEAIQKPRRCGFLPGRVRYGKLSRFRKVFTEKMKRKSSRNKEEFS